MRRVLIAVALAAAAGTARADDPVPPQVTVHAGEGPIVLGEVFHLYVTVVHAPELGVKLPDPPLDLGAAFSESGKRIGHRSNNPDGTVTTQIDLSLLPTDVGELEVPALELTYAVGASAHSVTTQPLPVRVDSFVGEGAEELRPIAPPVAVSHVDWTLAWILGGAIAAPLCAVLAWLLASRLRRRTKKEAALAAAVQVPADVEALARLDALEASGLLDAEDRRPAYFALSEIVRAYLGRLHAFPALELTTAEIAQGLAAMADAAVTREVMGDLLVRCDLVKFAGWDAGPDEAREATYQARILIEKTRPGAAPAPAPQPAQPPPPGPLARESEHV